MARYFCRVLRHLDRSGATGFTPVFTAVHEADVAPAPFLDFTSGYVQRASAMAAPVRQPQALAFAPELRSGLARPAFQQSRRRRDGFHAGRARRSRA
ncbi:hypothetical protein ACVBEH_06915 [Roseateles sp. GG27B]